MNSLYNITNRFVELIEKEEELTVEEYQEQGNELAQILQNKAEDIVKYNYILESNQNALKQEIERLTAIKKTIENRQNKFKAYVKENMEKLGIDKLNTPVGNLTIAKSPISVEIEDITKLDKTFVKTEIKETADKTAIKKHFQETGEIIVGVKINTSNTNLRIK